MISNRTALALCLVAALSFLNAPRLTSAQSRPAPMRPPAPAQSKLPQSVARPLERQALSAPLPKEAEEHPVHLSVDWNAGLGAFPHVWLGVAATDPYPLKWDAIAARLKTANAGWIRINPFDSGLMVRAGSDPLHADYSEMDRMLRSIAAANTSVILDVSSPSGQSPGRWTEWVQALAQRYGKGAQYSVLRWEFLGSSVQAREYYTRFTKIVGSAIPERPVGYEVSEGDPVEAAKVIAGICSTHKIPLNSFAWTAGGSPNDAVLTTRRIRTVFSRFPALKGTSLLPLIFSENDGQDNTLLQTAVRLADYAPLERANGLLGVLAPLSSTVAYDGAFLYHGEAFALLNRLSGVRLDARTDTNGVRCIAAKSGGGLRILVWREDQTKNVLLGLLHVRSVTGNACLRMENVTAHYGSDPIADVRNANHDGDRNRGTAVALNTVSQADIKVENGEAEIALPIEPFSAALITLQPAQPRALETTLSASRGQWYFGETLDLDVLVRNTSRLPQRADVELLAGAGAPVNGLKGSLGILAPGASGRLRFRPVIIGKHEGTAYLNVRTSSDSRATLAVQVLSPIAATLLTPRIDLDAPGGTAQARIRLVNQARAPVSLSITTVRNGHTEEQALELAADGKSVDRFIPVSAASRDAGTYPVEIGIDGAGGRIATLTPLVGVPIACRYATLKPTIDGDLSEWTDSEPMGMGRADQVHEKAWKGPTDLSGYAYARWDEQFLYVACAVTDDIFLAPFPVAELWRGDSVQFAFSTDRSSLPKSAGYSEGDHEFGMALLDGAHAVLYRFFGPAGLKPGTMKRGAVAIRREGTRTFYEAAVPWTDLGRVKPAEGTVFGFSILINDNDGQGRGYISWSDGIAPEKRPMLFPPLRLVR